MYPASWKGIQVKVKQLITNLKMNHPHNIERNVRHFFRMAVFGMVGAAGLLLAANDASAQTTNAFDVATNSAYNGLGMPNGLSTGGQNGGFGFGAWTFTLNNATGGSTGGSFIATTAGSSSGENFDIWNTAANASTVAVRPFSSALVAGQSFSVQFRLNSLNGDTTTNALMLQDASGNTLFSYWHVGNEANSNNGHYTDAITTNGTAVNFQYQYQTFVSFTFTLNSSTTYNFTDNTTGHSFTGVISGVPIAQVAFFRGNGTTPGSGGQDLQFDTLQIVSAAPPTFSAQSPATGAYSGSRTNVSVQVLDGGIAVNTNTVVFQVDGSTVVPAITKSGGVTTITFSPGSPLSPGVLHTALVTLADNNNTSYTNTWSFTTGFPSLPATLPGPIVVSNNESGLVIFSAAGDDWLGANYGANSSQTIYTKFSMEFDNLNGETGSGGGYGGLHFFLGGSNGTPHLIAGNAWLSTNWSVDPYPPLSQSDLLPVTPIVFQQWHTIVERVDYTPGGNSTVNVWLDPDFTQTEAAQPNPPVTISMVDTFDTILLRTGNGTTSATFSNIVMAATSASVGFAAPAAPQFQNLVPAANAVSAAVGSPISALVVFGTYGIGTNTVVLTLDGTPVTPTFVVASSSITVNYQPPTPFVASSSHTVALSITDSNGAPYSTSWSFTVDAYPTLPVTLAGPIDVAYSLDSDAGITIFGATNGWIGSHYQSSSTNTLYTQFSMTFFDLNGETGSGGGYGGLHFIQGDTMQLIVGNAWFSTNWSVDAAGTQFDLSPVVPVVLGEWHTMVVKSVFSANAATSVEVWLDPDFTKTEANQSQAPLAFTCDNTFDTVRLRCGNGSAAAEFTNIVIAATSPFIAAATLPVVNHPVISGGNLILTGNGGTAGASYTLLTTTNLTTPIMDWTTNTTGTLDATGAFSNAIPVNVSKPTEFFIIRVP
jgi:hypothetical protein